MIEENKIKHDRTKLEIEQESKEWQASSQRARQVLAKIAEGAFEPNRNSREKLKQQAQELLAKRGQTDRELETKGSTGK